MTAVSRKLPVQVAGDSTGHSVSFHHQLFTASVIAGRGLPCGKRVILIL